MVFLPQQLAAALEALLDNDADTLYRGSGLLAEVLKGKGGFSVGEEIVDDKYFILGGNIFWRS